MSSPNVTAYLAEQKRTAKKELCTEWTQLEELFNEKYVVLFVMADFPKLYTKLC